MGRVWCIHVNVGSQNLMLSADGNDGMRTGVLQSSNLSLPNDSILVRSLLDMQGLPGQGPRCVFVLM